jgi:dynein heavy chain
MRTSPGLEAFEAELRKYNVLEQEIAAIPTLHNIGGAARSLQPRSSPPPVGDSGRATRPVGKYRWQRVLTPKPPGSLSLETAPLKNSLRSEAASWKAQFAQNLHRQCAEGLKAFDK